jgi:hypothetical protein
LKLFSAREVASEVGDKNAAGSTDHSITMIRLEQSSVKPKMELVCQHLAVSERSECQSRGKVDAMIIRPGRAVAEFHGADGGVVGQ